MESFHSDSLPWSSLQSFYYTLAGQPNSAFPGEKGKEDLIKEKGFIVSKDNPNGQKGSKVFSRPMKHSEAASMIEKLYSNQKIMNYYEVIPGYRSQKFFLDIDISLSNPEKLDSVTEKVMSSLVELIRESWPTLTEKELQPEKDICLYSSHGQKKRSFHLVFPRFILCNHREAQFVYNFLLEKIPPFFHRYLDGSVYSKKQNFRLLYSSKKDHPERMKKVEHTWKFGSVEVKQYHPPTPCDPETFLKLSPTGYRRSLILDSFITHINRGDHYHLSQQLRNQHEDEERKKEERNYQFYSILPDDFPQPPEGLEIRCIDGDRILLSRKKPSFCPICQKTHDSEGASLKYYETKNVWYLHCFRQKQYGGRDLLWFS